MKCGQDHIWHEDQHSVTYLLSSYGDESSAHEMSCEQYTDVLWSDRLHGTEKTFIKECQSERRLHGGGGTKSLGPEEWVGFGYAVGEAGLPHKSKQYVWNSGRGTRAVWVCVLCVHEGMVRKPVWLEKKDRLVGWRQLMKDFASEVKEVRLVDHRELTLLFELNCLARDLLEIVTWASEFGESEWLAMRHLSIWQEMEGFRDKWRWKRRGTYKDISKE